MPSRSRRRLADGYEPAREPGCQRQSRFVKLPPTRRRERWVASARRAAGLLSSAPAPRRRFTNWLSGFTFEAAQTAPGTLFGGHHWDVGEVSGMRQGFARVLSDCGHEFSWRIPVAGAVCVPCLPPSLGASEKRALQTALWVSQEVCAAVPHRQFVFTIPKRLRIYFRFDRRLAGRTVPGGLGGRAAVYRQRPISRGGSGHDRGDSDVRGLIHWHPHIHALVSEGCSCRTALSCRCPTGHRTVSQTCGNSGVQSPGRREDHRGDRRQHPRLAALRVQRGSERAGGSRGEHRGPPAVGRIFPALSVQPGADDRGDRGGQGPLQDRAQPPGAISRSQRGTCWPDRNATFKSLIR